MIALLCVVLIASTNAQFDFGTNGGACSGSGEFRQQIAQDARLVVGDIPSGLEGLEIAMITTGDDVDIQLTSGETEVINWEGDIINEGSVVTKTWSNDAITYSGYGGDGINAGNEYVMFKDGTSNAYRMWAYGYQPGVAVVTYSWTGQTGCTGEGGGPDPFGKGNFRQVIEDGAVVVVGDLPAGLTDVYVRLDSEADIDIQLYDGDVAVVDWVGGLINGMFVSYPITVPVCMICPHGRSFFVSQAAGLSANPMGIFRFSTLATVANNAQMLKVKSMS